MRKIILFFILALFFPLTGFSADNKYPDTLIRIEDAIGFSGTYQLSSLTKYSYKGEESNEYTIIIDDDEEEKFEVTRIYQSGKKGIIFNSSGSSSGTRKFDRNTSQLPHE